MEPEPTVQHALSGESADHIPRRSKNMERHSPSAAFSASSYSPTGSYQRNSRQFPTMGDLSMDTIYENSEWPWRKPLEIIPLSSSSPRRVVEIGVHSSEEFGSHNEEGHGSEL